MEGCDFAVKDEQQLVRERNSTYNDRAQPALVVRCGRRNLPMASIWSAHAIDRAQQRSISRCWKIGRPCH